MSDARQAEEIIAFVAKEYRVPVWAIFDRHGQWKTTCLARSVAYALIRQLTRLSYPEIGWVFGRHHTTVMHGVDRAPLDDVERMLHRMGARGIS